MTATPALSRQLEYALKYAARGWKVFPVHSLVNGFCTCGDMGCKNPGKHPATTTGFKSATTNPEIIRQWWAKTAYNIGLHCEGFQVLDVDPRNGGDQSLDEITDLHGELPDTVKAQTGGGGEHYLFLVPEDRKLRNDLPGIDVKDAGGYIVVEPSIHHSGKEYAWEDGSDPFEGAEIADAPEWLLQTKRRAKLDLPPKSGQMPIDPETVLELRQAFPYIPMDGYQNWLMVGQALHNEHHGQQGFGLWIEASRLASNFDPAECKRKWLSFTPDKGLTIRSIFKLAQENGWQNPMAGRIESSPIDATLKVSKPGIAKEQRKAPPKEKEIYEPELECLPGVLGEVYEYVMSTSSKPQPLFAMQTALAFGSIITSRRYVGCYKKRKQVNYTSLFFLNVGKTGCGKEHAKTALEDLLEACGLEELVGPNRIASESGLVSMLIKKPRQLAILDEFGKLIGSSKSQGNYMASDVVKSLMETWGRCHGTIRQTAYSTFGLNDSQQDELDKRLVRNPALSLLCMTTPETLFKAAGSEELADGFLNRFLTAHSTTGRQMSTDVDHDGDVPDSIIRWAEQIHNGPAKQNPTIILNDEHDQWADRIDVPYSDAAWQAFRDFEAICIEEMDKLDKLGIADIYSRAKETAMRVSVIIALSCHSKTIEADHAAWAINYVHELQKANVDHIAGKLADTPFQALKNAVMEVMHKNFERGLTHRDITQRCRPYKSADPATQDHVIKALLRDGDIELREFTTRSGRNRQAWVPVDSYLDDDDQVESVDKA